MVVIEESAIWQDIDRSEKYLICSMYDDAASLASSILKNLLLNNNNYNNINNNNNIKVYEYELMKESAAMVLVQSLNYLGRAAEIVKELKLSFDTIPTIPVQIVLTGVCFQISEGSLSGIREFLEEFLNKWSYVDKGYYILAGKGEKVSSAEDSAGPPVLEVDKYLDIVEVYAVTLLGRVLNDRDAAFSWVEKADLPEESRQALLRRLSSLYYSLETTNTSDSSSSLTSTNSFKGPTSREPAISEASPEFFKPKFPHLVENGDKSFFKLSKQANSCFWLFRTINVKFGETRIVVSNGKILLGCLVLVVIHIFKKKRASMFRIAASQASYIKKALVDLWQLAFSYQVNPMAAVQPISSAAQGAWGRS